MSHTKRLRRSPKNYRQLTGITPAALDRLLAQLAPHHEQAEARRKDRPARKLRFDEVKVGIVSGYKTLEQGGGQDRPYLADALDQHQRVFARAHDLLAANRGMSLEGNQRLAKERRIKTSLCRTSARPCQVARLC